MYQTGRVPQRNLELAERDLKSLKDLIEDLTNAYEEAIEQEADVAQAKMLDQERQELVEDGRDRMQRLKAALRQCIPAEAGGGTGSTRRSHLAKVALPVFTGQAQDWPEFKRVFTKLTAGEDFTEAVLLAQLREALKSKEAKDLVEGITSVSDAWETLNGRFGDRDLAVISVKYKLLHLDVSRGQVHERVEALVQGVNRARATLRNVHAEQELLGDLALVAQLVGKLPSSLLERWHLDRTEPSWEEERSSIGMKFFTWLDRLGRAANSARLTQMSLELARQGAGGHQVKCSNCGRPGHKSAECQTRKGDFKEQNIHSLAADNYSAAGTVKMTEPNNSRKDEAYIGREEWKEGLKTEEGTEKLRKKVIERGADCPICKKPHFYTRKLTWGQTDWPSNRFDTCPGFKNMSPQQRNKQLVDQGGCVICLSWAHPLSKCGMKEPKEAGPGAQSLKCQEKLGAGLCGKLHHSLLHGADSSFGQVNSVQGEARGSRPRPDIFTGRSSGSMLAEGAAGAMFELLYAPVRSQEGARTIDTVFIDGGSNMNFVTNELAAKLGLEGTETTIFLRVVDEQYREKEVTVYRLGVEDRAGSLHWMEAVGVESMTDGAPIPDQEAIRRMFPEIKEEALHRPVGPVGLLLSMTERHLHGDGGRSVARMRLSNTRLGCGQVLTGVAPPGSRRQGEETLSADCRSLQGALADRPSWGQVFHMSALGKAAGAAMGWEDLEPQVPPLCSACRGCRECKFRREKCSTEDQEVLDRVEKEMELQGNHLVGTYPWRKCSEKMRSNREQALTIQAKVEARQIKAGSHTMFQDEVRKAIEAGSVKKLSEEELNEWEGPVNYNNIFEVVKEESLSTKCRVVSNSAQKNIRSGLSLNDCMKKRA